MRIVRECMALLSDLQLPLSSNAIFQSYFCRPCTQYEGRQRFTGVELFVCPLRGEGEWRGWAPSPPPGS